MGRIKEYVKEKVKEYIRKQAASTISFTLTNNPLPIEPWFEKNLCEPTVLLPIQDFCRPGDVVFDVGANAGAISVFFSRLVGPKGIVCAFEASPRIIDKLQSNLVKNGCSNVQVYNRAVYERSNELIKLFPGKYLNDSIFPTEEKIKEFFEVKTLALDDFVSYTSIYPKFIKMDIEGAEFSALQGMKKFLEKEKPILVLEQGAQDLSALKFLLKNDYRVVDLATYKEVISPEDLPVTATVYNILCIHKDRIENNPYFSQESRKKIGKLGKSDFMFDQIGSFKSKKPICLKEGRYICKANVHSSGTNNRVIAGVEIDGKPFLKLDTYSKFLTSSYNHWVFHLTHPKEVSFYFQFIEGKDPTLEFSSFEIEKISSFDGLETSLLL